MQNFYFREFSIFAKHRFGYCFSSGISLQQNINRTRPNVETWYHLNDHHDDDHDQERVGDAGHGLGERGHDLGEGGHALEQAEDTERTERPEQPEGGRQDLDVRSELDQRDRAWIALGLACGRALGLRFGLPGAR